ncbi:MAG: hypothetical protein AAF985_24340 [Bacteroidota bacterium]
MNKKSSSLMTAKLGLLILGVLLINLDKAIAQDKEIIKREAKSYCKCYKKFEKKQKRLDKKEEKERHKDLTLENFNKKMKLFGGEMLDFSFSECLEKKRNKTTTTFLQSLEQKEKDRFRKKVKRLIKKKCPEIDTDFY